MFKLQYFTSQLIEVESTWRACVRDKTKRTWRAWRQSKVTTVKKPIL